MNASVFRGARFLIALLLVLTVAASLLLLPGFALPALFVLAIAAWTPYLGGIARNRFQWRDFWRSELAAVVGTFYFARSGIPGGSVLINGSATAPTAIQASQIPILKCQMVFNAGQIQGTITHNWGLDKSSPTYFDPELWYVVQNFSDAGSGSYVPLLTFDLTNTNVVLVNKLAGVAAFENACTFLITLRNNAAMLASAGGPQ